MSAFIERCPSYKESNKGNKQRQGPTLGVRLIEVSIKRESTVQRNTGLLFENMYFYCTYSDWHVLKKKNENITITGYWALNENRKIDSQQEKLVGPNRKN